ncbi:MAG: amidohydrolase family protein [Planctomycetia bacterium]|nr:amidohydrolase family protein [Planctomycetia bacterium]
MAQHPIDRRAFLAAGSLLPAAILCSTGGAVAGAPAVATPAITDTSVHLFNWPFRRLKYGTTAALIAKLKRHRVTEAWAGTFEAVLRKNLDAANAQLAEECRKNGEGMLRPFGSVCPVWPDWEEDLRRCHEVHRMPGIRLYPNYHNYTLDRPEFAALLRAATARGLLVQIAIELEDIRVHHPVITVPIVDAAPLATALKQAPGARVQLLNGLTVLQRGGPSGLVPETNVAFDIANLEGTGTIGRLIDGNHWTIKPQVPAARLLFGSHAPFFPFEAALLRLFESPLTREQLQALMHENAKNLLTTRTEKRS